MAWSLIGEERGHDIMGLLDSLFRKRGNKVNDINDMEKLFNDTDTELAYSLYYNNSSKYNSLKLPKAIVNTIVTPASQEFDFSINTENNELNRICKYLKNNLKIMENHLCIGGRLALKPYIKNDRLGVVLYGGRDFVAFYDDFGELEKVYFRSEIRESEFNSYVLVEIHTYDADTREYKIENNLYQGTNNDVLRKTNKPLSIGGRLPLSKCKKTAMLDDFYVIEDVDRHLCSVINLDNSMTYNKGNSIYASSIGLIGDAEKIYESLLWEMKGGELAIDAPTSLFQPIGSSSKNTRYNMPEGKDRLYRKLDGAPNDFDIKVFSPALRDENYIRSLNEILRKIELNCGLYYGALSNVDYNAKTATEIINSKQRTYALIMDIKNRIKIGIDEIIQNSCTIYNRMMPNFMRENITVNFEIGDSVIDLITPNNSSNLENKQVDK